MEESLGAQYAIQIAVHTLRDRCKNLQHRITVLEEENIQLRIKCTNNEEKENSLSELDTLRIQVTELTEQKDQLQDKIKMVANENSDLWNKLGKLITVNKNLGEQLSKINETVRQHTSPQNHTTLIRSKTFTQDEPQTKFLQKNLEINEKVSLELENVSLKLTDSFSKQKMELEKICCEMEEIQSSDSVITENFGFCFEDEVEDDLVEEFKFFVEDLKSLRDEVVDQKCILQKNLETLNRLHDKGINIGQVCDIKKSSLVDKETSTIDIPRSCVDKCTEVQHFVNEEKVKTISSMLCPDVEKMCPVCTRMFGKDVDFSLFERHVEDHFNTDVSSYELL